MKIRRYQIKFLVFTMAVLISSVSQAATFQIAPSRPLPTTIPQHGAAYAYYLVSNLTGTALNNNFVKNLPPDVKQVTCQSQFCGTPFNLAPTGSANDNCVLKLLIKGPVLATNSLQICTEGETTCQSLADPLMVTQVDSLPFIGVGAGLYLNNSSQRFPLLATTQDSGASWFYPTEIFTALNASIDPNYRAGSFAGAACSGENDKTICIAPGQYSNNVTTLPLIAVGHNNATSWNYPHSVFEDLQTTIDPNFVSGELRGAGCSGSGSHSICIAAGDYSTGETQLPLLAQSTNGGTLWTYPESIHTNLKTAIDPDFVSGFLTNASCSKSTCQTVCVASGGYCNATKCNPLLALSNDKGSNWTYPAEIFQNLPTKLDPGYAGGNFESVSCTGSGNETICTAAGAFVTNSAPLPMIALTQNGGSSWSYPPSVFTDLATRIAHGFLGGIFNSVSCTGSGPKSVCIAAGTFFRDGPNLPFIAVSRDAGSNWDYPDFIYTKLKTVVDPRAVSGNFSSTSCTGKGKHSICVAAGNYCLDNTGCSFVNPLIAVSTNGGKSWSYPPSVYEDLKTKIDPQFQIGLFRDVSCSGDGDYNFCVAQGQYANNVTTFPLTAISMDSGKTWTYPSTIFNDLKIKVDLEFWIGVFNSSGTTGGQFPAKG